MLLWLNTCNGSLVFINSHYEIFALLSYFAGTLLLTHGRTIRDQRSPGVCVCMSSGSAWELRREEAGMRVLAGLLGVSRLLCWVECQKPGEGSGELRERMTHGLFACWSEHVEKCHSSHLSVPQLPCSGPQV